MISESSEVVPRFLEFHTSSASAMDSMSTMDPRSTAALLTELTQTGASYWNDTNVSGQWRPEYYDVGPETHGPGPSGAFADVNILKYIEPVDISHDLGYPYPPLDIALSAPPTQISAHQLVVNNSRPADFLAIQETQGESFCWRLTIIKLISDRFSKLGSQCTNSSRRHISVCPCKSYHLQPRKGDYHLDRVLDTSG